MNVGDVIQAQIRNPQDLATFWQMCLKPLVMGNFEFCVNNRNDTTVVVTVTGKGHSAANWNLEKEA